MSTMIFRAFRDILCAIGIATSTPLRVSGSPEVLHMDTAWKEMFAALAAGTKLVPFGDNARVYAELEKQLECVRRRPQPDMRAANEPRERDRAA